MTEEMRARVAEALMKTPAKFLTDGGQGDLLMTFHGKGRGGHDYDGACALCRGEIDTLLDAIMAVLDEPDEPGADDLAEQMRHRKSGVYRLFWKSGGSSVAAVGMLYDGAKWYAPANWTTGSVDADRANVVGTDWSGIERAELIEAYRNTTRRYEPGAEDAP